MTRIAARLATPGPVLVTALLAAGCSLNPSPAADPGPGPIVTTVRVEADRPWTDTGLIVKKGDRFFLTATGEVQWAARHATSGPDGIDGLVGWRVGPGGLVGRVGEGAKPFAIGSRTTAFPDHRPRPPHHSHPAPPVTIPANGKLMLGFKDYEPGDNRGGFDVIVRRDVRAVQTAGSTAGTTSAP